MRQGFRCATAIACAFYPSTSFAGPPPDLAMGRDLASRQPFRDFPRAVADLARLAVMLAGAVAVAADILAGAGGAGRGFVAGFQGFAAHGCENRQAPQRFPREPRARAAVLAVMKVQYMTAAFLAAFLAATPAAAGEVFGGIYVHDVETPLNLSGDIEQGVDLHLGWRGERIGGLSAIGSPSPHAFLSVNSSGDTHFAAAGVSWKIGDKVYLRPGIGLAVHTGPGEVDPGDNRIDFGSRILFAPEIGVGVELGEKMSVEASWVHLSHATVFSGQNPGIDNFGVRLNYRFR